MTKDEALEAAISMMQSHTIREYVRKNHKVIFKKLDATIMECHKAQEENAWQGLSDDEIFDLHNKWIMNSGNKDTQYDFARAIEQALKEKNKC